jgi:pimeloyl-ACP methyl ester carboxylesterase
MRAASLSVLVALGAGLALSTLVPPALAAASASASRVGCSGAGIPPFLGCSQLRFVWMQGFDDPATPDDLDRVGVLKVGSPLARNVLVLVPGTSAGAAYFEPLAEDVVARTHGRWQIWSVERRENQLEDQSALDRLKQGQATAQEAFDYYLGWLVDPSVTDHFQLIPDSSVDFARGWGMNVEIQDLHRVIQAAARHGRRVVLGGHSLGGSITTAYATWDFEGRPGAKDLDGLVYIDGGSNPVPISADQASQALANLQSGSPWLAFGGIPTPFLGLFSATGACGAAFDPDGASLGFTFPLLPADLKPPLPAGVVPTNEAEFGFGVDASTSPSSLIAAQVHAGHLADSGNPRGWVDDGITPIQRYAAMLCGSEVIGHDGSAWYHPLRLTIDSGAVADGNANAAQDVLDVHAIHGADLGRHMPIYAFGAALGGEGVLMSARILAEQSGIPDRELTLVDRQDTYSHNDPSAASPINAFLENLIPFLERIQKGPHLTPRWGSTSHAGAPSR